MAHIEQNCENIVLDVIPEEIRNYTDKSIPTDITDEEIDLWLAMIPDLMAFWEARVVEKRQRLEDAEQTHKTTVALAFNAAPENIAVKVKENMAQIDPKSMASSKAYIEAKYSMQLTQVMFNKVECKSKSIHKIASFRARRLEVGVVAPSIRGNPEARRNPIPRPPMRQADSVVKELRSELNQELNKDPF